MDAIHAALWPAVQSGDHQAAAVLVRASARKAALYGLDAPVRAEQGTGDITVVFDSALDPARQQRPQQIWDEATGQMIDYPSLRASRRR